ncbi:2-oxo acid dehydrogenase subunit E2 [Caulobacter sp. S45]|uniref:2-oxo acid dehydrogenase subunit E2 n=1 Tax=Caulobacter sp. S45 TaxID=1641861 RepID=UPI00131D5C91|nr:2-oxo acid dehydrogenase subunit E2 [Caulobacter sp. S45]
MSRFTFRLPDLGEGTAEAEIIAWHVAVGDRVEEDQALVDIMTDKATVEITSPVSGVVAVRRGEPGEMFAVGGSLLEFEVEGDVAVAEPQAPPVPNPAGQRNVEAREASETMPAEPAHSAEISDVADFTFRLPDLGEGTAEAEIVAWHVKPGDRVEEDQPLVEIMTDKATVEITSPVAGRIVSTHGEIGKMQAVGSPLVLFATGKGAPQSHASATPSVSAAPVRPAPPANAPAFFRSEPDRPLTSPAIRRRAREADVDLSTVKSTGPEGRITREDLDAHLAKGSAPARAAVRDEIEEVKVIGLRRKIAEKMSEAKRRIPHFAYIEECDVTELEDLRVHLNATRRPDQPKLTVLPFLILGLAKALAQFPQINARYDDEAGIVRRYRAVHLGMATQTPNGLIVPVIRNAQALDVWALASEIGRLAEATRKGSATKDELSGSTITLTSLGPLGGVAHTPVINHPEVAIVGPNKIIERPVVRHGQIVVRKMMNLSSSFDHRVVDGYDAAEFIQVLKGLLEHPATLFMI